MAYGVGHLSSSSSSNCIVCGKKVSTYVDICDYTRNGFKKNTTITIPVCDGEHRKEVFNKKDIFISYAKSINGLFKINKK